MPQVTIIIPKGLSGKTMKFSDYRHLVFIRTEVEF